MEVLHGVFFVHAASVEFEDSYFDNSFQGQEALTCANIGIFEISLVLVVSWRIADKGQGRFFLTF
jgi:hypothetical protein